MAFIFPAHIFDPKRVTARVVQSVVSGGVALNGEEDVIATDGGGRWEITFEGINLTSPEKVRAWEAWEGYLGRGTVDCLVPLLSLAYANRPQTGGKPVRVPQFVTDNNLWPESAGYADPYIVAIAGQAASMRATTLHIEITAGAALEGGEKFSYNGAAYRVIRALGDNLFQIEPPLREAIPFGADLNFDWPTTLCRSAPGESWSPTLSLSRFGEVTIRFLENASAIGDAGQIALDASKNVTNHFTLPGDGMEPNKIYQNTTGLPVSAQAFLTSGLMPITDAMRATGFTMSIDGAAPNWLMNAARVNFYSASAAADFISSVTAGVTLSADLRTLTVAAASIPAAATHFGTNLKWAQGIPSLVFASSNVIPTGAEIELAKAVMVNSGTSAAALSPYGTPKTKESISTAPDLATGEFVLCQQGYASYMRKPWKSGKHIVQKVDYSPESRDYNNTYQFRSVVQIDAATPAPLTPGAFAANYSGTGASANTFAVQSDCHPAYKINGMFMGGAHGITSSLVTSTAHGKSNVDVGSIWSVGGTSYMLTGVYDANRLFLTALNTGTETEWSISGDTLTSGTATHVSDATNTADFTISTGILAYLYPATALVDQQVRVQGGLRLVADGVYTVTERAQAVTYRIPNAAGVLDAIAADVGSSEQFDYNNPALPMQLQLDLRWNDDAWASSVTHQVTALQDHHCDSSWPTQWQAINARSSASETLHFIIPGTVPCGAALDHSGTVRDFGTWNDITANTEEYYHDAAVWEGANWWADGIQRAALVAGYGVKDSGGNWLRKFIMARSRIQGWTAENNPTISHFLSTFNKAYAVSRWNEDVEAGDVRSVVAGYGWMDPAFDPLADINFTFPLGGGRHEWIWHATAPVAGYSVPKRSDLAGKKVEIVCRSASCSVIVGSGGGITVTTSGEGGFTALVY
ncbi:hypothetical protein [Pelagerythrobacter aerophilus]|uniref:Uncharacterized protein n=1 Tax=Pelagerythrobacter aerophilus TaxID=2306995 RepID=A0A418NJR6_9SPHN|nr:hypothetical protein [Pelagerythrobacter aerophilus]RIV79586.1 hypothetical protein D2V04_06345 [Pelagerythrobacter aerophilus]